MAFIEPRLIHLLNDSTTPQFTHVDLPSFRETFPRSPERPLPVEPSASHRDEGGSGPLPSSHAAPHPNQTVLDETYPAKESRKDNESTTDRNSVGNIAPFPLRLLLGETDQGESSYSLTKILDETPESQDDTATKKRHRALTVKDDFVQLPQPVKKQKATQQQVMPPIINGLHEPPPDAALFPPIASSEFDEPPTENAPIKSIRDFSSVQEHVVDNLSSQPATPPKSQKPGSGKTRKKAMKPRRKWSEAETTHLLLGVNRHGVGKWTDILADPDFDFNNRTAGDLKDRFRTCCPNELRSSSNHRNAGAGEASLSASTAERKLKAKTGLLSENILINQDEPGSNDQSQGPPNDEESGPKTKRTRAHRKKVEDLVELGIHGPFKKSHRRERRPFSEQDDKQILDGLELYGPAWTKIQRDPRFSLSGRQPTDLRDRVRNKYPTVYQRIEKGLFTVKDTRGNDTLEPSVSMAVGNTFQPTMPSYLDPQLQRVSSKEELPRWPLSIIDNYEFPATSQPFDFGEATNAPFMGSASEMDISRLLLDDSQVTHHSPRYYGPDNASDSVSP